MMKTFRTAFKVDASISCNNLIFRLQSIPLFGRLFGDGIYRAGSGKMAAFVMIAVFLFAGSQIKQMLYFFITLQPALLKIGADGIETAYSEGDLAAMCWILLMMNVFIGGILNRGLSPEESESTMTKLVYLNLNRKEYYLSRMIAFYAKKAVLFILPFCLYGTKLFGAAPVKMLLIIGEIIAFRIFADGIASLPVFRIKINNEKSRLKSATVLCVISGAFLAAAYIPIVINFNRIGAPIGSCKGDDLFYNLFAAAERLMLDVRLVWIWILAAAAGVILIRKFADYDYIAEYEISEFSRDMGGIGDYNEMTAYKIDTDKIDRAEEKDVSGKRSFEYLNSIFMQRHRKLFKMRFRLMLVVSVLIIGAAFAGRYFNAAGYAANQIFSNIGIWIFAIYLIAYKEAYTLALFTNVDKYLLHYNWYRKPDAIFKNYTVRLRTSFRMNILLAAPLLVAVVVASVILGSESLNIPVFTMTIIVLTLFYSTHYLTLYYLVQPYTEEMKTESFAYRFANGVVYMVSFIAFQEGKVATGVLVISGAIVVTYLAITFVLLKSRAPESFRLN